MHSGELTKYLAIGFVGVSILVMGYILYALEETKHHFATQIIDQSSVQIRTELDQFFMPVEQLIRSLEQQSSLGLFDDMDLSDLNRHFIPLIERYPQLSSVGLADGRGHEVDILPHPERLLAPDVTLRDITRFSQGLSITENNQIFILTRNSREIIGLPSGADSMMINSPKTNALLMTPEEFGSPALVSLASGPVGGVVSFDVDGETWWGLLQPYPISSSQELLYAILIPEQDFASEIHRTRNATFAGFLIILALTLTLVRSHNSLDRARNSLNEKNDVILRQKERLFSEVHHRVKNNLAVMSALMELEQSASTSPDARDVLSKTQRRVKSMAAVHEIMYQSDDLNRVRLSEFLPGILSFAQRDLETKEGEVEQEMDDVLINVNQALTYALLMNELMSSLFRTGLPSGACIRVHVHQEGETMQTHLHIVCPWDPDRLASDKGSPLIRVLVQQLDARMERLATDDGSRISIAFELADKKGVAGNMASSQL